MDETLANVFLHIRKSKALEMWLKKECRGGDQSQKLIRSEIIETSGY
jgi:hypothetical protein